MEAQDQELKMATRLIMRPTYMYPGIYEDEFGTFVVTTLKGASYRMIWTDKSEDSEPGDLVFDDVCFTSMDYNFGDSDGVVVEKVQVS